MGEGSPFLTSLRRWGIVTLAVFAALIQPLGLVPLWVYTGNPGEFQEPLFDHLQITLGFSLAAALALGLLISVLARSWSRDIGLFFVLCGTLFWIQSSFLSWDFGALDGQPIAWSEFTPYQYLELCLWTLVFLVGWWWRKRLRLNLVFLSLVLAFLPLAGALLNTQPTADTEDSPETGPDIPLPPDQLFEYSFKQNYVHIFLDTFRTDVFKKILAENPTLNKELDGFTLFEQNITPHSYTWHAFPSVFSGQSFRGSAPFFL